MSQQTEQTCSICMMDFQQGDSKVSLGCSHQFHYNCILTWNLQSSDRNHRSCPLCREDMEVDDALEVIDRNTLNQAQYLGQPVIGRTLDDGIDYLGAVNGLNANPNLGLQIRCEGCSRALYPCDCCGTPVCGCNYDPERNYSNFVHCPQNPFDEPIDYDELEEGELPEVYCSRCFEHREETVIDFMMDDHGDIYIFHHERMQELYERFYQDTSGRNNDEIYRHFRSFTFEEFEDYMTELQHAEMQHQLENDVIDLIPDDFAMGDFNDEDIGNNPQENQPENPENREQVLPPYEINQIPELVPINTAPNEEQIINTINNQNVINVTRQLDQHINIYLNEYYNQRPVRHSNTTNILNTNIIIDEHIEEVD